MFSDVRGESTSFGRGGCSCAAAVVSFSFPLSTGRFGSNCRLTSSARLTSGLGLRWGRTADGRILEGPNKLTISSVCDSFRRFDGCELLFDVRELLFDIYSSLRFSRRVFEKKIINNQSNDARN